MNIFYSAAAEYATKYNFAVIPCVPKDKRPLTSHGCKDASRDVNKLKEWWDRWPTANIGIACGKASGDLVVLDIDGNDGQESLRNLERSHGELPSTPCVLTGKGEQYYFKNPLPFKNLVGILPGIDLRSEAGYVIAPPSIHPNGKTYLWEIFGRIDEVDIAPLPAWLVQLLQTKNEAGSVTNARDWSVLAEKIKHGMRNQTLASVAGHLFRKGVDTQIAYTLLWAWNKDCLEPPISVQEFNRTLNSIAGAEIRRRQEGSGFHG